MVGFRVALLCHIPNFRCLCQSVLSLGVFAKLLGVGWGGAGGDGWILGGNPVSHTKFQVSMSIRSLTRSFCQIENDEKS